MSDDRHTLRIANEAVPKKICQQCGALFGKNRRYSMRYWSRAKYCGQTCSTVAQQAEWDARRLPIEVEFAKHFQESEGCWEWTWIKDKDGYGLFPYARRQCRAHVLALELDGRPVPKGMYGCHTCDNPACVRPSHLYPGTPTQNMADAKARGRTQVGERRHSAKLTEDTVRAIRASNLTDARLGEVYGVSHSNISLIRTRKTWRHVR